jgi:uncharacterized membrane protein YeiH
MNTHVLFGALFTALDLGGTFVFAISGAVAGVKHRLDLFGVFVLSFAAANAGGIARDAIIGATPAASISDWRYLAVSVLAGLLTFYRYSTLDRMRNPVLMFDAMGLALFAVTGTTKALSLNLGPVAAVLLGVLTAVGGGIVRDVLVAEIPVVLRSELYAVAAVAGGIVVVLGDKWQLPTLPVALVGAAVCFGLRLMAIRRGWRLPVAQPPAS